MPKRAKSPEEDVSANESESEAVTTPPPKKAKKTSQAKAVSKSSKSSKQKPAKPDESSSSASKSKKGDVTKNAFVNIEGEKFIDLGRKRRATVRSFKGQVMVDIREFYGDEDDLKPGKKGISLSLEQWEELKSNVSGIDGFIKNLQ